MIEFLDRAVQKFSAESSAHNRFLIVSGPRSGSSYLSSLLRSHPDIISYSELFHPRKVALGPDHKLVEPDALLNLRIAHPVEFIDYIYNTSYSENVNAVGFKLLYRQARTAAEHGIWEWLEQHEEIRVIHLVRDNMLAQFLSIRQALARHQWTARQQPEDSPLRLALPEDECEIMFRQTSATRALTRHRFQNHPCLEIEYDDLVAENSGEIDRIIEFLGVSPHRLSSKLVRMNPWPPEACIRNFENLKTKFQNTQWARFFEQQR